MSHKSRIIFVDDELSILRSIRRELRSEIAEWDMLFCESPQQALNSLAEQKPLVVVCDKRMLQMDGVTFLNRIRERSPSTIRVLLTGETSQDVAFELASLAHMMISKPYEHEDIINVLHRAKSLEALPVHDAIKQQLGSVTGLPVLPKLYTDLRQLLDNEEASAQDVAQLISGEPMVLAKLIQLANSPFLGFSTPAYDPVQTIMRLGLDLVSKLVLTLGVFNESKVLNPAARDELLRESIAVADMCRHIALNNNEPEEQINNVFLLGMLHKIGYLVPADLRLNIPEYCPDNNCQEDLIGAYILSLWEFNQDYVEAIFYHERIEDCPEPTQLTGYLYTAALLHRLKHSEHDSVVLTQLNKPVLSQLSLWDAVIKTLEQLS